MISKFVAILIVLISFIGGFLLEGGNFGALWHPTELLIIGGMGIGVFLGSTPPYVWMKTFYYLKVYFLGGIVTKKLYNETLLTLDEVSRYTKKNGIVALEVHLLDPYSSSIFSKHPSLLKNEMILNFIVDNLTFLLFNPPKHIDIEKYFNKQITNIINDCLIVPKAVSKVSNLMPGFGIIAAVLGVILTMNLLNGDMDIGKIGESIGSALVGTLTGIFISFAIMSPFSNNIEIIIKEEKGVLEMISTFILALNNGVAPALAIEIGRQLIPHKFRDKDF